MHFKVFVDGLIYFYAIYFTLISRPNSSVASSRALLGGTEGQGSTSVFLLYLQT